MKTLEIATTLQIKKSAEEVFEAIVNPEQMKNYFISESDGRMESGKTLNWKFPEFDEIFPVKVEVIEKNKLISFNWETDKIETNVIIKLESPKASVTTVRITEKSRDNDDAGIRWLKSNTAGWANFLDCLKAWLEYGINLRKGSFDYMKGKVAQ